VPGLEQPEVANLWCGVWAGLVGLPDRWEGAKFLAQEVNGRLDGVAGRQLAFVLDEGGFVIDGAIPGMNTPVASMMLYVQD
jgi:hypothetical protein